MASLPVESVSRFILLATTREAQVLKTLAARAPVHEADLMKRPAIRTVRLAKNHGQLMALVEALAEMTDMPQP